MDDPKTLINIGDLAEPANTLILKISDAVGGIFKPAQIIRIAEAETKAEIIRAGAQIQITEIQRQAATRFFREEANKQENMESIVRKALPEVTSDAHPDQVDNDWITHFFDRCRLISDGDMQNLWAKVLSGQVNSPGTFTKKTIDILADLEKFDAILFSKLCNFSVILNENENYPLIYDTDDNIYNNQEITFVTLVHLENLGLIRFDAQSGFRLTGLEEVNIISYFDSRLWIKFAKTPIKYKETNQKVDNDYSIGCGNVMLTKSGQQLSRICDHQPVEGFTDYLKKKWNKLGYQTEPDINQSTESEIASKDD